MTNHNKVQHHIPSYPQRVQHKLEQRCHRHQQLPDVQLFFFEELICDQIQKPKNKSNRKKER